MLQNDITSILLEAETGDRSAFSRLFPLAYHQLRAVAHDRLATERRDHTLKTTALVHEAYVKLVDHPAQLVGTSELGQRQQSFTDPDSRKGEYGTSMPRVR